MLANHKYFHWLYFHKKKRHAFNISSGIFIWLFLGITRPFGISNNNFEAYIYLFFSLILFGSIWVIISYLVDFSFEQRIKKDHAYDLKIWGLKLLLMIHLFLLVRGTSCDWTCIDEIEYLELWIACILMVGFCYLTFSLYARYLYFHSIVGKTELTAGAIELLGEGKESKVLSLEQIAYIKADDNYVDIFMADKKETLRSSLSAIEEQLQPYSQFVRIHRSYIINFHFVADYPKKDTLLLGLENKKIELPVSKKYQKRISPLFTHPK